MFKDDGIDFNAVYARGRCLPHTVHLAALKVRSLFHSSCTVYSNLVLIQLLEGIGTLSTDDVTRAEQNYQESVTLPISREKDIFASMLNGTLEDLQELTIKDAKSLSLLKKVCSQLISMLWSLIQSSYAVSFGRSVPVHSNVNGGCRKLMPLAAIKMVSLKKLSRCLFLMFEHGGPQHIRCAVSNLGYFIDSYSV